MLKVIALWTFMIMTGFGQAHASASAAPTYITKEVPQAAIVGQSRLTYMMLDVYDARLYAPQGRFSQNRPLALSLTYLRDLKGKLIADRSIEEMRKQGFKDEVTLAAWHNTLLNIFPDVRNGTNLTGVLTSDEETIFYLDGAEIGRVQDAAFGKSFFSIWLGKKTSEPAMRNSLLNIKG